MKFLFILNTDQLEIHIKRISSKLIDFLQNSDFAKLIIETEHQKIQNAYLSHYSQQDGNLEKVSNLIVDDIIKYQNNTLFFMDNCSLDALIESCRDSYQYNTRNFENGIIIKFQYFEQDDDTAQTNIYEMQNLNYGIKRIPQNLQSNTSSMRFLGQNNDSQKQNVEKKSQPQSKQQHARSSNSFGSPFDRQRAQNNWNGSNEADQNNNYETIKNELEHLQVTDIMLNIVDDNKNQNLVEAILNQSNSKLNVIVNEDKSEQKSQDDAQSTSNQNKTDEIVIAEKQNKDVMNNYDILQKNINILQNNKLEQQKPTEQDNLLDKYNIVNDNIECMQNNQILQRIVEEDNEINSDLKKKDIIQPVDQIQNSQVQKEREPGQQKQNHNLKQKSQQKKKEQQNTEVPTSENNQHKEQNIDNEQCKLNQGPINEQNQKQQVYDQKQSAVEIPNCVQNNIQENKLLLDDLDGNNKKQLVTPPNKISMYGIIKNNSSKICEGKFQKYNQVQSNQLSLTTNYDKNQQKCKKASFNKTNSLRQKAEWDLRAKHPIQSPKTANLLQLSNYEQNRIIELLERQQTKDYDYSKSYRSPINQSNSQKQNKLFLSQSMQSNNFPSTSSQLVNIYHEDRQNFSKLLKQATKTVIGNMK